METNQCSGYFNPSSPNNIFITLFFFGCRLLPKDVIWEKKRYWLCKMESVGCQRGQVQVEKLRSFDDLQRWSPVSFPKNKKWHSLDNHLSTWRSANHFELWERPLRALVSKYTGVCQLQLAGCVKHCPFTVAMLVESLIFIHACTKAIALLFKGRKIFYSILLVKTRVPILHLYGARKYADLLM